MPTCLQEHAAQYAQEITELLGKMPRVLLLLLKTNDCLRQVGTWWEGPKPGGGVQGVCVRLQWVCGCVGDVQSEGRQGDACALREVAHVATESKKELPS